MSFVQECLKELAAGDVKGDRDGLEAALAEVERGLGEAAPPGFARFLLARLPSVRGALVEAVMALRAGDLLFAFLCLEGQPVALRRFEEEIMPRVAQVLRRTDAAAAFIDEASNETRERLLLAKGARAAGLEGYLGQGPLASYAMVVAMRVAVDLKRKVGVEQTLDEVLFELEAPVASADASLLKASLGPAVQKALIEATAALTPRERTLLKLHLVQGVSADALAKMYRVHRATTTRWIADAREKVHQRLTERLRKELALGEETFSELKNELFDGLDLTLSGVLTNAEPPP
ncbi:MAG: hypothetical protein JNK82_19335 [Myxococcaceae bacterium]|nr:hypothetical protein [Myxococcaceae bacterium]